MQPQTNQQLHTKCTLVKAGAGEETGGGKEIEGGVERGGEGAGGAARHWSVKIGKAAFCARVKNCSTARCTARKCAPIRRDGDVDVEGAGLCRAWPGLAEQSYVDDDDDTPNPNRLASAPNSLHFANGPKHKQLQQEQQQQRQQQQQQEKQQQQHSQQS